MAEAQERIVASRTKTRHLMADGYRWTVHEAPAPLFDRRGGTHLIFDGELIMRRVRAYRADWFDLPDEDLYALSLNMQTERDSGGP
jgi:hypothetical protein